MEWEKGHRKKIPANKNKWGLGQLKKKKTLALRVTHTDEACGKLFTSVKNQTWN